MSNRTKPALHTCECTSCQQHPYSKIAREHTAINRVLAILDERNKRRFVGLLASQQGNILLLSAITGLSRNTGGGSSRMTQAGMLFRPAGVIICPEP